VENLPRNSANWPAEFGKKLPWKTVVPSDSSCRDYISSVNGDQTLLACHFYRPYPVQLRMLCTESLSKLTAAVFNFRLTCAFSWFHYLVPVIEISASNQWGIYLTLSLMEWSFPSHVHSFCSVLSVSIYMYLYNANALKDSAVMLGNGKLIKWHLSV